MPRDIETPTYIESLANELLAKYRALDKVLTHAPTKGSYHERLLRKMLRRYLPSSFSVGEGFIINQEATTSGQLDILVVDNLDPRSFGYKEDDFFIASDMAVTTIGEVKTRPTRSQFIKSFKNLVRASQIIPDAGRVTSFIFCYDVPASSTTFDNWIKDSLSGLSTDNAPQTYNLPDYVFCLKKGFMQERKPVQGGVQYMNIRPGNTDPRAVRQKIMQDLFQCVTNGCGRLRSEQGINPMRQ